ncbi:hypothetical protein RR46_05360 [Papilio xuthus]|uniref:Uncharacterized protein n=1 Tax=Papilio xuthus TaxID=66420 RepID=A0A194Q7Y1_PAPXU|nr:hypothetical protein RR46_05360 [Papilio xuthus]
MSLSVSAERTRLTQTWRVECALGRHRHGGSSAHSADTDMAGRVRTRQTQTWRVECALGRHRHGGSSAHSADTDMVIKFACGEGKHRDATCTCLRRNSKIYVKSTNSHYASVVDNVLVTPDLGHAPSPSVGTYF